MQDNMSDHELDELLDIPKPQSYSEFKQELKAEQSGMSREDIARLMDSQSETVFDPETAEKPKHNWVDRGLVMSCEGAGHPNHRHFKIRQRR